MPAFRSALALTVGSCSAAVLFAGVTMLRADDAKVQAPTPDVRTTSGSRLYYPADRSPRITLSGGRIETIRSVLNIRKPMRYGDSVWDEADVPKGPVWVRVDPERQLISVFRAGQEIGTAVVLYGAADKQSPEGAFPVLEKAKDYHSRTYDAPMPFTLRLTADGVAIHGADVRRGAATHGCIGVPEDFARRLFAEVKIGDLVVIERSAG